jgi:hypothetical protein
MSSELSELIRDARKELRQASGAPLTPEEREEDVRKAAVVKLEKFMVSRLGIQRLLPLHGEFIWTEKGPTAILEAEDRIFHLRKDAEGDSYPLFILEGDGEREIARFEAKDPYFASRVLVAIADAAPCG